MFRTIPHIAKISQRCRFFSSNSNLNIKLDEIRKKYEKAGKEAVALLKELEEQRLKLGGSHEKALQYMRNKYPGSFIDLITKESISKAADALEEAAKSNPGGYW